MSDASAAPISRPVGVEIIGVQADEQDINSKAQRMCEIRLDENWKSWITDPRKQNARLLKLQWNPGVSPGGKWAGVQRRVLRPGDTTILDIGRAQAWFGLFTIPRDVQDVIDERRVDEMWRNYHIEKARALLTWGDFQKGALQEDADTTFGPARFPDVWATVIEANGERWEPIRLRDLYELGEYQEVDIPRTRSRFFQQQQLPAAPTASATEIAALKAENAENKGLIMGLMASMAALTAALDGKSTKPTKTASNRE